MTIGDNGNCYLFSDNQYQMCDPNEYIQYFGDGVSVENAYILGYVKRNTENKYLFNMNNNIDNAQNTDEDIDILDNNMDNSNGNNALNIDVNRNNNSNHSHNASVNVNSRKRNRREMNVDSGIGNRYCLRSSRSKKQKITK